MEDFQKECIDCILAATGQKKSTTKRKLMKDQLVVIETGNTTEKRVVKQQKQNIENKPNCVAKVPQRVTRRKNLRHKK